MMHGGSREDVELGLGGSRGWRDTVQSMRVLLYTHHVVYVHVYVGTNVQCLTQY